MQRVFVLSKTKKQLMPCKESRARRLLKAGKAKIYRMKPFTIILTEREDGDVQAMELKLDLGSKTTGVALVADFKVRGKTVVWSANLNHRGQLVKKNLESRRASRHARRARKTRYRQARFLNRKKSKGWLPPSLLSRVNNVVTWTKRLSLACPITSLEVETCRFDTQKMQNAEISSVEYQQGELQGYEVREYLLEKYSRECAYCQKTRVPLEVEHIIPKSRGGSNRVSNLTIACKPCNDKKGTLTAKEFGHPNVEKKCKKSLKDASAVNATRYKIGEELKQFELPLRFWSGARTKMNRIAQDYEKEHWIDAASVGETGAKVTIEKGHQALDITAIGRGSRQMCRVDQYGFPRTKAKSRKKLVHGFQTGDIVKAIVTKGKNKGAHTGKVVVRARGSFDIKTKEGVISSIGWKNCKLLQKADGYCYV